MAEGDQADQLSKQLTIIPQGWVPAAGDTAGTPESPHPVLDAILSGFSALWAVAFSLIEYAAAQMRIPTSTDGWLELAALDYFGQGQFPRLAGETDTAYAARIEANILPIPPTRAAISAAITALTGQVPRIDEEWSPGDTGVYNGAPLTLSAWDENLSWDSGLIWDQRASVVGGCYYSRDGVAVPGRYSAKRRRAYQVLIDTTFPVVPVLNGAALPCYGANAYFNKRVNSLPQNGTYYFNLGGAYPSGQQYVLDLINKWKVEGTIAWVRFNGQIQPS